MFVSNFYKIATFEKKCLERRVYCGYELYKDSLVKKLIVSGGLGKEGWFEAEKMKDYLVELGVPNNDIIVDNNGSTTYLSANNYLEITKLNNFSSLIVVSQFYHISRTKLIFKKKFRNPVSFYWFCHYRYKQCLNEKKSYKKLPINSAR